MHNIFHSRKWCGSKFYASEAGYFKLRCELWPGSVYSFRMQRCACVLHIFIHNEQRFPELAVTTLGSHGHDYVYTSPPNKMFGGPGAGFQDLMVNHRSFVCSWRQLLSLEELKWISLLSRSVGFKQLSPPRDTLFSMSYGLLFCINMFWIPHSKATKIWGSSQTGHSSGGSIKLLRSRT